MWASFNRRQILGPLGLTLLRGLLACLIPFLVLTGEPSLHVLAFLFFIIGMITDFADGYLARKYKLVTPAGIIMDPTMDKILILMPLVVFSSLGFYSQLWLIPVFVRELFITFCRIGWMLEGTAVAAEKLGKWKMALQCAFVFGCFLLLLCFDYDSLLSYQDIVGLIILMMLPLMVGLTLVSGITFLYSNRYKFDTPFFAKYTSAFGVGLIPRFPGTLGSAAGLGLAILCHWNVWLYLSIFIAVFWGGFWAVNRLHLSAHQDPHYVVVDEVCGMLLTLLFIPLNFATAFFGFFLFRFFDVLKPFPLRRLEKLPGYWGIMLDDIGAAIYSWMILYFIQSLPSS